jgi:hypothetical protein
VATSRKRSSSVDTKKSSSPVINELLISKVFLKRDAAYLIESDKTKNIQKEADKDDYQNLYLRKISEETYRNVFRNTLQTKKLKALILDNLADVIVISICKRFPPTLCRIGVNNLSEEALKYLYSALKMRADAVVAQKNKFFNNNPDNVPLQYIQIHYGRGVSKELEKQFSQYNLREQRTISFATRPGLLVVQTEIIPTILPQSDDIYRSQSLSSMSAKASSTRQIKDSLNKPGEVDSAKRRRFSDDFDSAAMQPKKMNMTQIKSLEMEVINLDKTNQDTIKKIKEIETMRISTLDQAQEISLILGQIPSDYETAVSSYSNQFQGGSLTSVSSSEGTSPISLLSTSALSTPQSMERKSYDPNSLSIYQIEFQEAYLSEWKACLELENDNLQKVYNKQLEKLLIARNIFTNLQNERARYLNISSDSLMHNDYGSPTHAMAGVVINYSNPIDTFPIDTSVPLITDYVPSSRWTSTSMGSLTDTATAAEEAKDTFNMGSMRDSLPDSLTNMPSSDPSAYGVTYNRRY